MLAAASLEPGAFVSLYLAIFDGSDSGGGGDENGRSSKRQRFASAAKEVEAMKRKQM